MPRDPEKDVTVKNLFSPALLLVPLFSGGLFAPAQEPLSQPRQDPDGRLRRVEPRPGSGREADPLGQVFARQFDAQEWRALLGVADLEQREKNLDDLLRRAQFDPFARAFLEELARDADQGELAWTARLALRELGRSRFPVMGTLGDPFVLQGQLEDMFRELWSGPEGMGLFVRPPGTPAPRPGSSTRSVQIHQDEHGARLEITEIVDGQEKKRTYEGTSLDEILERNPGLEQELSGSGIALGPDAGRFDVRFDLGGRRGRLDERPGEPRLSSPQGRSQPVRTDVLGVMVKPLGAERSRHLGLEEGLGLVVVSVYPGSYAHLLGVSAGDVLVELDGTALRTDEDIERAMRAREQGAELTLVWIDALGQRRSRTWQAQDAPR